MGNMRTFYLVLLVIAAVLFAVAAVAPQFSKPEGTVFRVNLVAAGLLAWVLVPLCQQADLVWE
jgi:hypothetical protein